MKPLYQGGKYHNLESARMADAISMVFAVYFQPKQIVMGTAFLFHFVFGVVFF